MRQFELPSDVISFVLLILTELQLEGAKEAGLTHFTGPVLDAHLLKEREREREREEEKGRWVVNLSLNQVT